MNPSGTPENRVEISTTSGGSLQDMTPERAERDLKALEMEINSITIVEKDFDKTDPRVAIKRRQLNSIKKFLSAGILNKSVEVQNTSNGLIKKVEDLIAQLPLPQEEKAESTPVVTETAQPTVPSGPIREALLTSLEPRQEKSTTNVKNLQEMTIDSAVVELASIQTEIDSIENKITSGTTSLNDALKLLDVLTNNVNAGLNNNAEAIKVTSLALLKRIQSVRALAIHTAKNGAQSEPSQATKLSAVDIAQTLTEEEIERKSNEKSLEEIAGIVTGLPTELNDLVEYKAFAENILRKYNKGHHNQVVRQAALDARLKIANEIKNLVDREITGADFIDVSGEKDKIIDITGGAPSKGESQKIDFNVDEVVSPQGNEIIDISAPQKTNAVTNASQTTAQITNENTPPKIDTSLPLDLVLDDTTAPTSSSIKTVESTPPQEERQSLVLRGLIKSNRLPKQQSKEEVVIKPPLEVPPQVAPEVTQEAVVSTTDPKPEGEKLAYQEFMKLVETQMVTPDTPPTVEVKPSALERAKNYLGKLRGSKEKISAEAESLKNEKKLSEKSVEKLKASWEQYNALPKSAKIGIGLTLALISIASGGAAGAVALSAAWRVAGSVAMFMSLSKMLHLNYVTKNQKERPALRTIADTAGVGLFTYLVGSGLAGEYVGGLVEKYFPFEAVHNAPHIVAPNNVSASPVVAETVSAPSVTTPPVQVETPASPQVPATPVEVVPNPSVEPSSVTPLNTTPSPVEVAPLVPLQNYDVKNGENLWKIIRDNFNSIKIMPEGEQNHAIATILKKIQLDPTSYGVSSGDVNLLNPAGHIDSINLQKISDLINTPGLLSEQGIDNQTQNLTSNVVEVVPDKTGVETAQTPAITEAPLFTESAQKLYETKINELFGVKSWLGFDDIHGVDSQDYQILKEKAVADIYSTPSPTNAVIKLQTLLGKLSLDSGLAYTPSDHVEDYIKKATSIISNKANATLA